MLIHESEFKKNLSKYNDILYLCHRNADPDAIGSAFALQQAFGGTIGAVDDLSKSGKALTDALNAEILINPLILNFELAVIVDASVKLQLGNARFGKYAVVDHHLDDGLLSQAEFYIQRPANSTAEIVWKILLESGVEVRKEMALGLLVGIISDTGRFRRGSPESFKAAGELLEICGTGYDEVLSVLSTPTDVSQRIAVLKAASRATIDRFGSWLIATTEINAFEGSAAMALVDLGADIAFAVSRRDEVSRVSGRASRAAIWAGINLADLMGLVARIYGGEGGGHRAAAALEADKEPATLLTECKKRAIESLKIRV
ncbi:MAG: DHH family phosphoesterase [Methanotrichaceae archaeon]